MLEIFAYCKEKGILAICTPWDIKSLKDLESINIPAYKIASADLVNHELINEVIKTRKPIILSTGMSTENEVYETVDLLSRNGAVYILLHCNSTYPTPYADIQLNYMKKLKEIGNCNVGYSGHERGISYSPSSCFSRS